MLAMTDNGRMIGGPEAIEFFERLGDAIDEDIKDEEFCNEFTWALNRCRYSIARDIPMEPKYHRGAHGSRYDSYTCARCGKLLDTVDKYCSGCGQMQTGNYLGRRATIEEEKEHSSSAKRSAIDEAQTIRSKQ